jgi:myo-inositol-1(or 4)-monophosphatase
MLRFRALPSRQELEAIVGRAGALALDHFRRAAVERKADQTLVTAADRAVEAFLVEELGRLLPGAGILGEEGAARTGGPLTIVIDPIDGTASFVAGLPTWCVCVGIMRGSRPVAGVVHVPCTGETYGAVDGTAWWCGAPLPPLRAAAAAPERFIVTHSKAHLRHRIAYPGKVRSFGSAAYHVVLVARGAAEAALVGRPFLWDLAAPGAVLEAVGGCYEYLGGTAVDLAALTDGRRGRDYVIAGAPEAIAALRATIDRA